MRLLQVVFSSRAEDQLEDLLRFITEDSGRARAEAFVGEIVSFCKNLGTFPERGTRRDDLGPSARTIGFRRRATIASAIRGDHLIILGVFYGGQDFETILREEDG